MLDPNALNNATCTPITCPHCGSHEIAFVTEYHKCIFARIICVLLAVFALIIFIKNLQDGLLGIDQNGNSNALTMILLIISGCTLIGIFIAESKTHVQAICKDCGHLWLLN